MFIECQNGVYFNTDKAIAYRAIEKRNAWEICAVVRDDTCFLGEYSTEERAQKECRNIILWIRSVQGLEPSNPAFRQKFVYSMPK